MRKKFHSTLAAKSEEEAEERLPKKMKMRTPLHIPFHGTTGKSVISGDSEPLIDREKMITTTHRPMSTTSLTTTSRSEF